MLIYPGDINRIREIEDINLRWHKQHPRNSMNEYPSIILTQTVRKNIFLYFNPPFFSFLKFWDLTHFNLCDNFLQTFHLHLPLSKFNVENTVFIHLYINMMTDAIYIFTIKFSRSICRTGIKIFKGKSLINIYI